MKIMEAVAIPTGFTSTHQTPDEVRSFNKQVKAAKAKLARFCKAGYTERCREGWTIGDYTWETVVMAYQPSLEKAGKSLTAAVQAGRFPSR